MNEIESISWRIDYIFGSNLNPNMNQALTNVKFIINNDQNIKKSPDSVTITLNSDKLKLLIHGNFCIYTYYIFIELICYRIKKGQKFDESIRIVNSK